MTYQLTKDNVLALLNTGNEVIAQTDENKELHIGVGNTAYMYKDDLLEVLETYFKDHKLAYKESSNSLFVHISARALPLLVERVNFWGN